MIYKIATFFWFLLLVTQSLAQENYRFTSYTVEDGLPQNTVMDIIQDPDGFLWFATSDGLCRFDGYSFKNYAIQNGDSTTNNSNYIKKLFIDNSGDLWIATQYGIALYNRSTDKIKNILSYKPRYALNCQNWIFGDDGKNIWFGLCNLGLVKVTKQTLQPTIYRDTLITNTRIKDTYSWYSGFLEDGHIWLTYHGYIYKFNLATGAYSPIFYARQTNKIFGSAYSFTNLNNNYVLATTNSGILQINKQNLTTTEFIFGKPNENISLNCILKLSDTIVILGSATKGLMYFNTITHKIDKYIEKETFANTKKILGVKSLYNDKSGNLWIGTTSDGIKKLNFEYKKFKFYGTEDAVSNSVVTILVDSQFIYACFTANGLDVFSRSKGFIKNLPLTKTIPKLLNTCFDIAKIAKDKILLLAKDTKTNEYVFVIYNIGNGSLNKEEIKIDKNLSLDCKNLRQSFFKSNDGQVLFCICNNLYQLNYSTTNGLEPILIHRFEDEYIISCFSDATGGLWVGTFKSVYHLTNNTWIKVPLPMELEVKTIAQASNGEIWLGSPSGIYTIDGDYKITNVYTEATGLPNNHLYGLITDNSGNIWFSHNKGISVYDWGAKVFRHYRYEDGLQSNEFNSGAYCKAPDGELFFGGVNGITSFYPNEILGNPNIPKVNITEINLFDMPYKTDTAPWETHTLTLPYKQNCISFVFSAMEFTNTRKNKYSYKMEGVDKNWTLASNIRFARYAGLAPGRYVFKVKACNNDGIWNKSPTMVHITILPAFWQQTWFITIVLLIISGLIIFIISLIEKSRIKNKIKELVLQQKIQDERERISRDLHDNVGTQLTYINTNLEWLQLQGSNITEDEKSNKLSQAKTTSIEAMETLRETIWAIRKEAVTIEEFTDKLKSFALKQVGPYPDVSLSFNEQLDGNKIFLGPEAALNLFRICQEAISNSLKHSSCDQLVVAVLVSGGGYTISITDNGSGFVMGDVDTNHHFGIVNMEHRAKAISCSIDFKTQNGTIIIVSKK